MDIRTGSLDFTAPVSGSGPRTASTTVVFAREVTNAVAGLSGYWMGYTQSGGDHHVGRLITTLATQVNANTVTVTAQLGVRDWSGDWDDGYQGTVDFTVLADLALATAPPPRGDLIVAGVEHNQAIQFWRSQRTLDPDHIRPDNSIPLVSGKNTGLRVYPDYDSASGLPVIRRLTGRVTVQTGSTLLHLDPINSGATITPRRDAEINQSVADHTLNFMIPAAWSHGALTLSYSLWDADDPTQRPSPNYTETILFGEESALNYYVVGINYTAAPATAPPTLANFLTTHLSDVIRTYPMSDFPVNGYQTIDYGETVTGPMPSSGCGHGFDDLLDRMDDMQGDSDDIYVALLGSGIMGTPGNQLGGCGHPKSVAIFLDRNMDLPHESGHALGRRHAPCTMNRCNPAPSNTDPDYPQYGSMRSDSIGGFGFDPTTNAVFDPATTSDFMAYSGPNWVSAYTWAALAGAFATPPGSARAHGIPGVKVPVLHLGLTIDRDRKITRRPSFQYHNIQDSPGCNGGCGGCSGCGPSFVVEILDGEGRVLACEPLTGGCDCAPGCWPRHFRQKIVMPHGARQLKVFEQDQLLYEENVPAAPKLSVHEPTRTDDGMRLQWRIDGTDDGSEHRAWYLVQFYDAEDEAWRGVAPRQTQPAITIPWQLLGRGPLPVRILATSGLNTGVVTVAVDPGRIPEDTTGAEYEQGYQILLADHQPDPNGMPTVHTSHVLHAIAFDDLGKTVPSDNITWVDEAGTRLIQGAALDTRALAPGRHTLRAVVGARSQATPVSRTWRITTGNGHPVVEFSLGHPVIGSSPAQHSHPHR